MQRAAGEAYAATRRACRVFHAAWSEPHSRQRSPVQGLARRSSSNPGGGSAPVVFPSAAASRRRHISRTCSFLIPVTTCASPRCRVASTEEPSTPDPPEPDARGVQGRVPRATPAPKLPPNVSRPCAPSHHRCPLCRRRGPSIPPDLLRPARLGRERTSTSSNDQRPKSLISVAVLGAAILVAGARQKSVHHTTSAVGAGGRCVQGDVRCEPQRSTTNSAATTTDAIKLLRCCWPLAEPCGAPWATCRPPFVGRAACPMHSLKTQPQPAGRRSGTLCEAAWRDWRCGWC